MEIMTILCYSRMESGHGGNNNAAGISAVCWSCSAETVHIYMFYSDKHYSETKHSGGSIMLSEHFLLKESWNWNQSSCSNKVYHQGELFLFFLSPLIMGNHDRVLDGSAACKWMGPKGHLDFTDSTIIKEYMEALDETFIEEQTKTRCVWKANTVTLVSLSINL